MAAKFTYVFGNRTAFMAEPFTYRTVELAFKGVWLRHGTGGGELVLVYEGAKFTDTRGGYEGGTLVGVVPFQPLLAKVLDNPKPWKQKHGFPFFNLVERYIRLVVKCQGQ